MNRFEIFSGRFYEALVQLYPQEFRDEFADEMQAVFAAARAEAAKRGALFLLQVWGRELRDAPSAILRERLRASKRSIMNTDMPILSENQRASWGAVLLALIPFLVFGPLMIADSFINHIDLTQSSEWVSILQLCMYAAPVLILLKEKVDRGLPRWAYPYFGLWIYRLAAWVALPLHLALPSGADWKSPVYMLIRIGTVGFVLAALVLITRTWNVLHTLYVSVRSDWTPLCFALYIFAPAFMSEFGFYWPDWAINLLMWTPAFAVLAGAVGYLLGTNKTQRILALALGLSLSIALRGIGGAVYVIQGLALAIIIFSPALIELAPRRVAAQPA